MPGLSTDVGGFPGIGKKEVMIPLDDVRLTRAPDEENITVITRMSDQELRDAPEYTVDD